jgi:hypothetical protein
MTHVKNTEAFARLIGFCTGYGGKYNPGRPNLQMDALVNKLTETQLAIEQVKIAKTSFDNGVNQRKQTFDQVSNLVSSILRTLEASGAKPEKVEDARSFAHQIFGSSPKNRPALPAAANTVKPPARRSQLQLAYVSKADAFSKLVKAVGSEPSYQPREKEFSNAGLEEKVQELNSLNRGVEDARGAWRKAIIDRNESMYNMDTSMIKTAQAVKKYVRAVYGPASAQYALVKSLVFDNLNNT